EKVSANVFLQKNMNKIKASDFEMEKRMKAIDDKISERAKKIKDNDEKIYKFLSQEGIAKKIKSGIRDVVLNGATLSDNKTFEDLAKEEGGNTNKNSLNLLREYLRTPDEASKIHSKKGSLTKLQKFEIKSSFTANPIEGSNMMNKIENLMFDNVKTIDELKKNADELGDFLGFKLVNDKLFQSDGVSIIETLEGKTGNEFEEGMKKAKELFSKNLANTSEITITSKKYMGSFRDKEFEYKDMFTGKSINETGYSREMSFFARHPQQTINHFGGVQTIVLDTKNKNLNNKFARASLTFLSEEKNQAGVIILGKKTMLFRRGDQWSPHKEIYGKKYCERLTIGVLSA
ncbi:hypothetical protein, partial [uncultured Cetobacterium sp.]|uniref:hypothetical protein n=1 Tax=uncultured Cetobacterium sp. TaxID=527638 RepID=UPI0026383974